VGYYRIVIVSLLMCDWRMLICILIGYCIIVVLLLLFSDSVMICSFCFVDFWCVGE